MDKQILIFGTSNTFGCYDTQGGWADRLKQYCIQQSLDNESYRCLVYNLGISGNTSADIVRRFKAEAAERDRDSKSTAVLFDVGLNDSLIFNDTRKHCVTPEDYEENLQLLISQARELVSAVSFKKISPVYQPAVDPVPWVPAASYTTEHVNTYNTILAKVTSEAGVPLIDPTPAFSEPLERCFVDGVHPTSATHERIFKLVRDTLSEQNVI